MRTSTEEILFGWRDIVADAARAEARLREYDRHPEWIPIELQPYLVRCLSDAPRETESVLTFDRELPVGTYAKSSRTGEIVRVEATEPCTVTRAMGQKWDAIEAGTLFMTFGKI